ncbi:energy transducer TonB [Pseudomonas sp. UBA2684]|uniref:energy transducer TonB n=1 Tax=Pseudomonas sp. UBA2684 TaxID=1947311 RepID=UPI000E8D26FD|nr:energy transducer TonB [Pseudomonas sp. UBA2684]HBX55150.1 energy transducer TonB [Pseudomonas sp.]|tara:strand:+ start:7979 stop:8662 length:684 start_codon:yes stop_codon:yes gene_type:complete
MRVPLSFLGACLMALALFALMLYMVAPPRSQPSDEPVTVANFVRLDGESSNAATRTRQQAPQPPQPQTPQTPTPPTPVAATPSANLPALDLPLPSLSSGISVNSAPTPSLSGLSAGAAAPSAASPAPAGGQPGGPESEVMPLNDVSPEYPRYALQRGIQGHVKLAFTINRAGAVENVRVLEASPQNVFEREARRAAVRWRFAPRTEGGLAVAREAVKTLYFRLEGGR